MRNAPNFRFLVFFTSWRPCRPWRCHRGSSPWPRSLSTIPAQARSAGAAAARQGCWVTTATVKEARASEKKKKSAPKRRLQHCFVGVLWGFCGTDDGVPKNQKKKVCASGFVQRRVFWANGERPVEMLTMPPRSWTGATQAWPPARAPPARAGSQRPAAQRERRGERGMARGSGMGSERGSEKERARERARARERERESQPKKRIGESKI